MAGNTLNVPFFPFTFIENPFIVLLLHCNVGQLENEEGAKLHHHGEFNHWFMTALSKGVTRM